MYGDISGIREFDVRDIDEELVYSYYLGFQPRLNKFFTSPFRKGGNVEKDPSFRFLVKNGRLKFKCFSTSYGGTCIDLVMILYNLDYSQAVKKIKDDLYSNQPLLTIPIQGTDVPINEIRRIERVEKESAKIEVILRDFDLSDSIYWGEYGLNKDDLLQWDVRPCKEAWVNDRIWYEYRKSDPCYRYRISDKLKLYRPKKKGKDKWRTNATKDDVQGFRYLPEKGELLVITKSYKDIMVLYKHLGVNSISLSSESALLEKEAVDYLYSRFDNIIIWYDNDGPGIEHGNRLNQETGIPNVYIPTEYKATDPAALYKIYGKEKLIEVGKQLLMF